MRLKLKVDDGLTTGFLCAFHFFSAGKPSRAKLFTMMLGHPRVHVDHETQVEYANRTTDHSPVDQTSLVRQAVNQHKQGGRHANGARTEASRRNSHNGGREERKQGELEPDWRSVGPNRQPPPVIRQEHKALAAYQVLIRRNVGVSLARECKREVIMPDDRQLWNLHQRFEGVETVP